MKKVIFLVSAVVLFTACTSNQRARKWGGTESIILDNNEVLINATWKQDNLWILVKDTTTGQIKLIERSSFGIMEGKIIFK